MNLPPFPPLEDTDVEVSALIETLHKTEQRLEELTAGEVDAVAYRWQSMISERGIRA